MIEATQVVHFFMANVSAIYYLGGAVSAIAAVVTYRRNSALERARWLSSLYSKFYEALDLKLVRQILDHSPPNGPAVVRLVEDEESSFTDYLNFFEFMAYLQNCGQLSHKDIAALFDYYLRILNNHENVRKYVQDDRNGYGYLKKLLPRFC